MEDHVRSSESIPMTDVLESTMLESHSSNIAPRADGGRHAWLFLSGCFTIEGLIWGFPFAYGVFQQYYSTHEPFDSNPSGTAIIGTMASGIMFILAPFVMAFLKRFPQRHRLSIILGLTILCLSLIASSFATTIWQLIVTQGILYALGGTIFYLPAILYLDEWFIRRKGLALGVTFAGTGVGGVVIPLILNWALEKFGVRTTLQIWVVTIVVLTAPFLYFIRPRIPITSDYRAARNQRIDLGFLRQPVFWFLEAGNTIQAVGYFIPTIFLPTYAFSLGLSSFAGSLTLSTLYGSSIISQIALGSLSDRYPVTSIIGVSTIGSSIAIFLIWGLASSVAPLYIFSIIYGLFAGGFSSCWAAMVTEVRKKDPRAETGLVFGLLSAGRGVGCVVSGPLSNALLNQRVWMHKGVGGAYGTGYGPLIIFTGATLLLGSVSLLGKRLRLY